MFQLLNPTWLFAIAALSIPVIIHLWNIRPGKTLKVGSIAFIEASSRKSSRSFNFLDVLLLILRCLLLLILAVLLAQPFWNELVKPGKIKGWVLIPKQNIHQVYTQFKPGVDSLSKAGYELHYFNTGFSKIDTTTFKTAPDSGKAPVKTWVLLQQLAGQVPAALPIYVFAPGTINNLGGTRPQVALNLQLQTYTPADSTARWLQSAALISSGDAVKITEGSSKASGTTFTSNIVQATEQRSSAYQLNFSNGKPSVSFKGDTVQKAIMVDTSTLHIAIYSDKSSDGEYLKAALQSVKQFTARKISIGLSDNAARIPGNPDWVFWLKGKSIPITIAENIPHLFFYEHGKIQNTTSWINADGQKIALSKRIIAPKADDVIWSDGFGEPILSEADTVKTKYYHFYTHFDPAWNDMVWSDGFPKLMLNLILKPDSIDNTRDRRKIDASQLAPTLIKETTAATPNTLTNKTDLGKVFWLALLLIFLTERLLAYHSKTTTNNG